MPRDFSNEFPGARSLAFGAFGQADDALLDAIRSGARTGVSFAAREFADAGQPAPEAGQEVMVGNLVIRLAEVTKGRFLDVDDGFAANEAGSKQAWISQRRKELGSGGQSWSAFMDMYYCRFELVEDLGA